jgi:hypothetical protein
LREKYTDIKVPVNRMAIDKIFIQGQMQHPPLPLSPMPSLPPSPLTPLSSPPDISHLELNPSSIATTVYNKIIDYIKSEEVKKQEIQLNATIPDLPRIKRESIMKHFNANKIIIIYSQKVERALWHNNIDRLKFLRILFERITDLKAFKDYHSFVRPMLDCSIQVILRKDPLTNMGCTKIHVVDIIVCSLQSQLNKYETLLASCNNDYEVLLSHLATLRKKAQAHHDLMLHNFRERKGPAFNKYNQYPLPIHGHMS